MNEQNKEKHQKLVEELDELEHIMEEAMEENIPFHTLEEQVEKRKPPHKDDEDK